MPKRYRSGELIDVPIPAHFKENERKQAIARGRVRERRSSLVAQVVRAPISGGMIITRPRVPQFRSSPQSCTVVNSEMVINVTLPALGAFGAFEIPIISGRPNWLLNISDIFSKYRWKKMQVIWVPSCPTTTPGTIVAALSYDRMDALPTSFDQLTQNYHAVTFPPYAGYEGASSLSSDGWNVPSGAVIVKLDPDRLDKKWYPTINFAAFSALGNNIANAYCPASLFVASVGGPATATQAGNFFFKYEIEFIEPINPSINT